MSILSPELPEYVAAERFQLPFNMEVTLSERYQAAFNKAIMTGESVGGAHGSAIMVITTDLLPVIPWLMRFAGAPDTVTGHVCTRDEKVLALGVGAIEAATLGFAAWASLERSAAQMGGTAVREGAVWQATRGRLVPLDRALMSSGASFWNTSGEVQRMGRLGVTRAAFPAAGRVASNDVLAQSTIGERLLAYKAWKANAGIEGTPSMARFKAFVRGNTGRNGGGFYAYETHGYARLSRIERLLGETHSHHGLPQAFEQDFGRIGIANIDEYVFYVNGYQHIYQIHGGVAGGPYNLFWKRFLRGQQGPIDAANALRWLDILKAKESVIP